MSSRTSARSARSATNRQQPSSPPKQQTDRHSRTPVRRRTRSQSVEQDSNAATAGTKRGVRRNVRQGSVESETSNASASSRKGRTKQGTRTAVLNPELSMVAEDREVEEPEEEDEEAHIQRSQSPGGLSQMSGTTAITSHSMAELQDLDTILVEFLPELQISSYKILDLLAPPGVSENPKAVDSIVKDLKILGSRRAKRLKHDEEKFKADREAYGSDDYIQIPLIVRKVLGVDAVIGDFRPDAILHAANLATSAKWLVVTQKESRTTHAYLGDLDMHFPDAFLSEFDDNIQLGSSRLLDESFSVGLELRSQWVIVALVHYKDEPGLDPEKTLADYFFDNPEQRDKKLSYFDDLYRNGHVKDIMRVAPNTDSQNDEIRARVEKIREAFRDAEEAHEAGDLIDFERLDEEFPWPTFVRKFVVWTRLRINEITESIRMQGGVENIVKSLIETIKNNNSQADLEYNAPPTIMAPRRLLPPADIQPSISGTSYLSKDRVRLLEQLKRGMAPTEASSSNQNQQRSSKAVPSSSASGPSRNRAAEASNSTHEQDYDDSNPGAEDDRDDVDQRRQRSTAKYLASWNAHSNDKNKENRPINGSEQTAATKKKTIFDDNPLARKLSWDSQEPSPSNEASPSKRNHSTQVGEIEDQSEDEGFEADQRSHGLERRINRPTAPQREPLPASQGSSKRRRVASPDDEAAESERRNRAKAEAVLQRSARGPSVDLEEDDDESEDQPPNFTQTKIAANTAMQRARLTSTQPQKRTPWSENDTQHLVDLIENHGCSWSYLQKVAQFSDERGDVGQVALKDKARNIKVSFLAAGVPLPANFDKVPLGKKEIERVRIAIPDYDG